MIAVARRALLRHLRLSNAACSSSTQNTAMENIYRKIQGVGPITVADYMKECLLHPQTGYYMKQNMIGPGGDFITSPEISQVFGELLGVWVLAHWMSSGKPSPCQLVELGPGKGTLMQDILRVLGQFKQTLPALSVHLVEASPALSQVQKQTLKGEESSDTSTDGAYKSCVLESSGTKVCWYRHLQDVPRACSYYIAHEFFDALPVHQFKVCLEYSGVTEVSLRTQAGWREVLVDIDPKQSEKALRYVMAPGPSPASAAYSKLLPDGQEEAELCVEGLVLVKELAMRVKQYGGAALIADYGEEAVTELTLRAFRRHQQCDPLTNPGGVDLTADVDFGTLKHATVAEGAVPFGPISQNEFLHKLGIRQRIDALLQAVPHSSHQVVKNLVASYEMLTSPEKMGERFNHIPALHGARSDK